MDALLNPNTQQRKGGKENFEIARKDQICIDTFHTVNVFTKFVTAHTLRIFLNHAFSPCIVAMTFLRCFPSLNSKNHIPCHVPKANLPSVIGIETLAPMSEDLICAYTPSVSSITTLPLTQQ